MVYISLILFVFASIGGVTLLVMHFLRRPLPVILAVGHGSIAALGLITLTIAAGRSVYGDFATVPLVLFELAVVGGFALFTFHLRGKGLPISLALAHGGVAVAGFIVLLMRIVL